MADLKNEDILKCAEELSTKELYNHIKDHNKTYRLPFVEVPITSFASCVKAVKEKRKKLQKSKSYADELSVFMSSEFLMPKSKCTKTKPASHTASLIEDISCSETLKQLNIKLTNELQGTQNRERALVLENEKLIEKCDKLSAKVRKYEPKRINQKLLRKEKQIEERDSVLNSGEHGTLKRKCINLQKNLSAVKRQKLNILNYYRKQQKPTKTVDTDVKHIQELKSLNSQIESLEEENCSLREQIDDLKEQSSVINSKSDSKTYTTELREVIYYCSSKNVAVDNIMPVVSYVSNKLAHKSLTDIPDTTSCMRIIREMSALSKIQSSEALQNSSHSTLKYDGTTKKHEHYIELQLATKQQTFTLGLTKTAQGNADAYSSSFRNVLDDIGNTSQKATGENTTSSILNNISNTMTDRVNTNSAANANIAAMKESGKLNEFHCSIHPLDTFAKNSDKVLSEWEKEQEITDTLTFSHRGESKTQALIKAVAKLFYKDGVGCPAEISAFLKSKDIHGKFVYYFVGQRFHVLFHNAAAVYKLQPLLLEFLHRVWGRGNHLLQALAADLKIDSLMVACRALGIIGKCITGPWLKLGYRDLPILEMNHHFQEAVRKLGVWSTDATELLTGVSIFKEIPLNKDELFESLVVPHVNDVKTKDLLQLLCTKILEDAKRQLKDQLEGGKYDNPSESLENEAESCESNNMSGERVFGMLDHSVKRAPNANIDYHESRICYTVNKTEQWLSDKSQEEKQVLVAAARKVARETIVQTRLNQKNLVQEKIRLLKEKQELLSKKAENQRILKENVLEDLQRLGGLWITRDSMEQQLIKVKTDRKKIAAVKVQLKTRKIILCQKDEPSLFAFSKAGKTFTLNQLKHNLLTLIDASNSSRSDSFLDITMKSILENPSSVVGKSISHCWIDDSNIEKWYHGSITKMTVNNDIMEYELQYEGDKSYLQFDELVTDIRHGDLVLLLD